MDIKSPTGTQISQPTDSSKVELSSLAAKTPPRAWQVGQIIEITVVKNERNNLLLDIQGQLVEVKSRPAMSLEVGQKLAAQITELKGLPQLKILPPQEQTAQAILNRAMRTHLPQQQPLPPLLANIDAIGRQPQQVKSLPMDVIQFSQSLYRQLPDLQQIRQPQGLQQALDLLGPFLENHLARQSQGLSSQPQADLRTNLLRLATMLRSHQSATATPAAHLPADAKATSAAATTTTGQRPSATVGSALPAKADMAQSTAPRSQAGGVRAQSPEAQPRAGATLNTIVAQENALEELLRQVEGSLSRIQVQQLQSLNAEEQGRPLWAMELPLRTDEGIDLFDLRIQRDTEQHGAKGEQKIPWSITLAFDLEGLGPVRATVMLVKQKISAAIWAEQESTWNLFNHYLESLRSRMQHVGLEVGNLNCHYGKPETDPDLTEPRILDEKA